MTTAREVIHGWGLNEESFENTDALIAELNAAGFVIVPSNDIRPWPSLLSEEILLGLVAHLTAGTADLSIVRTQISRMRAAAETQP